MTSSAETAFGKAGERSSRLPEHGAGGRRPDNVLRAKRGLTDRGREHPHEFSGFLHAGAQGFHEPGAGDHAVSVFGRLRGGLRVRDAEPRRHGQRGQVLDLPDELRIIGGKSATRPGHARDVDVVHESGHAVHDLADAFGRSQRRHQRDHVQAVRAARAEQFVAFLQRQIDREDAVDADARELGAKRVVSVMQHRIHVAEQDDPDARIVRPDAAREREHVVDAVAAFGGLLGRGGDDRAVRHRVGERHAELDDVRAVFDRGGDALFAPRGVGISGGRKHDERFFRCENIRDSVHVSPCRI